MISDGIIYILYGAIQLLTAPLRALSDVSLPSGLTNAIGTASGYISSINAFVPVDIFLTILTLILVIEAALLSYKLIMWVLTKIPGVSN